MLHSCCGCDMAMGVPHSTACGATEAAQGVAVWGAGKGQRRADARDAAVVYRYRHVASVSSRSTYVSVMPARAWWG